jgi:hypothetical protein
MTYPNRKQSGITAVAKIVTPAEAGVQKEL